MRESSASLVPIWGIGLAGAVLGLTFVWHASPAPPDSASRAHVDPVVFHAMPNGNDLEVEPTDAPVTLRYHEETKRPTVLAIEHVSQTSDAKHRFRARFRGWRHRLARSHSGRSLLAQRQQYDAVRLELVRHGKAVSPAYLESIERNLRGATFHHVIDQVGDLRAADPGETSLSTSDPLLPALMTRTLELLMPRLRADRLLPGEAWGYAFPLRRPDGSASGLERGHIDMRVHFKGIMTRDERPFVVLDTHLEFSAIGPSQASNEARVDRRGHGEGRVLFDLEAGAVETSWLELTYRAEHDRTEDDRSHDIRLYLGTPGHDTT